MRSQSQGTPYMSGAARNMMARGQAPLGQPTSPAQQPAQPSGGFAAYTPGPASPVAQPAAPAAAQPAAPAPAQAAQDDGYAAYAARQERGFSGGTEQARAAREQGYRKQWAKWRPEQRAAAAAKAAAEPPKAADPNSLPAKHAQFMELGKQLRETNDPEQKADLQWRMDNLDRQMTSTQTWGGRGAAPDVTRTREQWDQTNRQNAASQQAWDARQQEYKQKYDQSLQGSNTSNEYKDWVRGGAKGEVTDQIWKDLNGSSQWRQYYNSDNSSLATWKQRQADRDSSGTGYYSPGDPRIQGSEQNLRSQGGSPLQRLLNTPNADPTMGVFNTVFQLDNPGILTRAQMNSM
jgi:hypothetical protein